MKLHKAEFCIFRIFTFCSKLSNELNRYIYINSCKYYILYVIIFNLRQLCHTERVNFISVIRPQYTPPPHTTPRPPRPTHPWQSLVYILVTIPWARPPSLIGFHLIDKCALKLNVIYRPPFWIMKLFNLEGMEFTEQNMDRGGGGSFEIPNLKSTQILGRRCQSSQCLASKIVFFFGWERGDLNLEN